MTDTTDNINDLNNEELARFILDMFHRFAK